MNFSDSPHTAGLTSFFVSVLITSCGVPPKTASLETVSEAISARTARGVPTSLESIDEGAVPTDVDLNDGIDEEEAVAIALWREPELTAALANLEVARADVITAGELPNPRLLVLFPYDAKLGEGALSLVLDSLITRSGRVEKAQFDAAALADRLVTHGLDLAHRVRSSFTQLRTLRRRLALTTEAEIVSGRLREISVARVRAGVATESEVASEASALGLLRDDARTIRREIERCALGLSSVLRCEPVLDAQEFLETTRDSDLPFDAAALEFCALRTRPELSAKRCEIDATLEREGLALADIIKIRGILDVNQTRVESDGGGGKTHIEYEAGPGVEVDLPVFSWGKGARTAAAATFERQELELRAIEARVALEVRDARLRLDHATAALRDWQVEQVANLATTVADASARFAHGAASEAQVLVAKRALLEVRRREIELDGVRRQAQVDLSRAVGCRLDRPLIVGPAEIKS